jgi:hypothetical protein
MDDCWLVQAKSKDEVWTILVDENPQIWKILTEIRKDAPDYEIDYTVTKLDFSKSRSIQMRDVF